MTIEAVSGAAAVALASTIVFLLIARSWQAFARNIGPGPRFSESIMREAAQRFRDELERLSSTQATYLSGGLMFVMLFGVAYTFRAQELFSGYPRWQMYSLLVVLAAAAVLAAWRLVESIINRRRLKLRRDANIAIGHQLRQITPGTSRVYHEVPTSAGVVDHVLAGQCGIYAINVIAKRPVRGGTVDLCENELCFSSDDNTFSIVETAAKTSRLEREFRKLLGHKIRVRSVIAVPGWQVESQSNERHLVVNERTIAMLTGWKDERDYLLNEDVETVLADLTSRCSS
jgi:hypothetical protein